MSCLLLLQAVGSNQKEMVKYLIKQGAHYNLQDTYGLTALTIAQKLGFSDLIEIMNPGSIPSIEITTSGLQIDFSA